MLYQLSYAREDAILDASGAGFKAPPNFSHLGVLWGVGRTAAWWGKRL